MSEKEHVFNDGDWAFDVLEREWTRVFVKYPGGIFPIRAGGFIYTSTGRTFPQAKHPTLLRYDPFEGTKPPVAPWEEKLSICWDEGHPHLCPVRGDPLANWDHVRVFRVKVDARGEVSFEKIGEKDNAPR